MIPHFQEYREDIFTFLHSFLLEKKTSLSSVNKWGQDSVEKLLSFVNQGKMIRGSMVLFSHDLFSSEKNEELVKVAAALELIHSALLIHDDIMDNDLLRRGKKTIFAQYIDQGKENSEHYGKSMAMCVGDMSFFFAYEILSLLKIDQSKKEKLIHLFSQELMQVCLAQMQDISAETAVTEKEVLSLYKYKTARYTFSLPIIAGALIAEQDWKMLQQLSLFGEYVGLIFQVKDDEIGLFGKEGVIGKPIGSDIKEGKQTLWRVYLQEKMNPEEKNRLKQIFGNNTITTEDIAFVQELVQEKGILDRIDKLVNTWKKEAEVIIHRLFISPEKKQQLEKIIDYNITRRT